MKETPFFLDLFLLEFFVSVLAAFKTIAIMIKKSHSKEEPARKSEQKSRCCGKLVQMKNFWIFFFSMALSFLSQPQGIANSWQPGQPVDTVEPEASPFWLKPHIWQKITSPETREVVLLVGLRPSQLPGFENEVYAQGAGLVNAPLALTYEHARKFKNLPQLSGFITESSYSEKTGLLTLGLKFWMLMKLNSEMQIEFRDHFVASTLPSLSTVPASQSRSGQIRFRVVKGDLLGLTGVFGFRELETQKTEMSMTAQMGVQHLPLSSRIFVSLGGLNTALQVMAKRLRASIEAAQSAPLTSLEAAPHRSASQKREEMGKDKK